jgi:hypothetical protein
LYEKRVSDGDTFDMAADETAERGVAVAEACTFWDALDMGIDNPMPASMD